MVASCVSKLNRSKAMLQVDVHTDDFRVLRIINIHLTSGMQTDSGAKRAEQLLVVSRHACTDGHTVIAGDFNERDRVTLRGFTDALAAVMPLDTPADAMQRFITFDPARNRLAQSGVAPGALDHVLVSECIRVADVRVQADVHASDHFPMVAAALLNDVPSEPAASAVAPVAHARSDTTALAIVLPFSLWPLVRALKSHAEVDTAQRWMPHLTVALGFVAEDEFARVALQIQPIIDQFLPVSISFEAPSVFNHPGGSATIVMETSEATRAHLRLLRDALAAVLGSTVMDHVGAAYTPHLSLQRCDDADEAARALRRVQATFASFPCEPAAGGALDFECDRLCMVSRDRTVHMSVTHVLRPSSMCSPGACTTLTRQEVLRVITAHCAVVRVIGSTLLLSPLVNTLMSDAADALSVEELTVATAASSDVDMHICLRHGVAVEQLTRALETCGHVLLVKPLSNAHGKYLQVHTCDRTLTFDLHIKATAEAATSPSGMHVVLQRIAATAPFAPDVALATFRDAFVELKRLMKACGVYGQRFGFPPGYGVAAMLCRFMAAEWAAGHGEQTIDAVIAGLCASIAARGLPIRSAAPGRVFDDMSARHIVIQSMLPPGDNIMRTATASSAANLSAAFTVGLDAGAFNAQMKRDNPHRTRFVFQANTMRNADAIANWFGARFLALLLKLERDAAVRPEAGFEWHTDALVVNEGGTRDSDYPFVFTFLLRSDVPLEARAREPLQQLLNDFYGVFSGCALDVQHRHGGSKPREGE